jgi:hypothetical protein
MVVPVCRMYIVPIKIKNTKYYSAYGTMTQRVKLGRASCSANMTPNKTPPKKDSA